MGEVQLMLLADSFEMASQVCLEDAREHGDPVLVALATPHHQLMGSEVNILDAQTAAFEQPEAGAIEQGGHQLGRPFEPFEHRSDLITPQDHWQTLRSFGADKPGQPRDVKFQHVSIQE